MKKPFTEMTNRELFGILTGEAEDIMDQIYLQQIVKDYLKNHSEDADLATMVRLAAEKV